MKEIKGFAPDIFGENLYDAVGWPRPVGLGDAYWHTDIDWTPMFGDRIKSCRPGSSVEEE